MLHLKSGHTYATYFLLWHIPSALSSPDQVRCSF